MDISIRKFEKEDTKDAIAIWNQVVDDGIAFPQLDFLDEKNGLAFFEEQSYTGIAYNTENGEIVGLYILHPNNVGRCGHICNASYAVKKDYRGQHIGEKLVLHCLKTAKRLNFKIMQFNAVVKANKAALALYKKLGFTQLGTIPKGFLMKDGTYEDIVVHYKSLLGKESKKKNDKRNMHLMQLIRHVHGLLENDDLQKQRDSQNQLASLLTNNKNYVFTGFNVNNLYCEWTDYSPKSQKEDTKKQIIFYCHGGGYMTGSCLYAREVTTKLAKQTKLRVFCFDYRLAPEHPYPAAIEDAFFAWEHITSDGFSPENIIIAGDSAGGNMALALTLMLKEKSLPLPKALILFSPWTDMTSSGESYNSRELLDPVLNVEYIKKATDNYLQGTDCTLPAVSPLFADFDGFPPVYIQVGDNEILLDDSQNLYKKLLSYNVTAKLDIFDGMWHVFQMSPVRAAKTAMDKISDFIKKLE